MRVAFLIGIHLVDASIYERYTRSDAKSQNTHSNLRPVVGWPRSCAVGNRKRVAHPTKRIVRSKGNRFLGTRFHPDHVSADSDFAAARNPESAGTHMGLFNFLGVCGFRSGHGLFHTGVEVRQPDGGKRGPEYSARYFNARRVFPFR